MMNAWRNAYAMHDTNAFYRHKSPEDHLFLLTNIRASWFICSHHHSALCMHLRRGHGPSDFPWQNDERTAMHAWWHNTDIHAWEHTVDSIKQKHSRRTSMVTPSNNKMAEMHTNMMSYPNFFRGPLFDGMQPLFYHFEVLGTLCCTIREVPRHAGNQKEALLRNPWNSVTCRKSKGSIVTQSVSFRNILKAKKGVITWPVRFRNLTERKQVSLQNS